MGTVFLVTDWYCIFCMFTLFVKEKSMPRNTIVKDLSYEFASEYCASTKKRQAKHTIARCIRNACDLVPVLALM